MSAYPWLTQPIAKSHLRSGFDCGEEALNEFVRQHARKSHERGASKTFVKLDPADEKTVIAYYTLSPAQVAYARVPAARELAGGRFDIAGYRLCRLAVAKDWSGQGIGGALLVEAVHRCMEVAELAGGLGLMIDAKSQRGADWYKMYGAFELLDSPLALFLPFATFQDPGAKLR